MKEDIKQQIERMKQTIDLGMQGATSEMNIKIDAMTQGMWKMIKEKIVDKIIPNKFKEVDITMKEMKNAIDKYVQTNQEDKDQIKGIIQQLHIMEQKHCSK